MHEASIDIRLPTSLLEERQRGRKWGRWNLSNLCRSIVCGIYPKTELKQLPRNSSADAPPFLMESLKCSFREIPTRLGKFIKTMNLEMGNLGG